MKRMHKRVLAGVLAGVLAVTSISVGHYNKVHAADLTFVVTDETPVANGYMISGGVGAPAFNSQNFYNGTESEAAYYYAGYPFSFLKAEGTDGNEYLFMAQTADWGTSTYSNSENNSALALANATSEAVAAKAATYEVNAAIEKQVSFGRVNGVGYETAGMLPPTNYKYYPIAAGDLINASGDSLVNDPTVKSKPGIAYWTRTLAGNSAAYYVSTAGSIEPSGYIGREEGGSATASDPFYVTQTHAIIPSFRMDMKKVIAEMPAAEDTIEVSPDPVEYNTFAHGSTHKIKYMMVDSNNNQLSSPLANKGIDNVYSNSAVLIDYKNAKIGDNKYISAIIYDNNGKILYYARLADADKKNGKVLLNVPSGLAVNGTYTLAMFEETYVGENDTQTCSSPVYMKFTLQDESNRPETAPVKTVTPEHIENMLRDETGATVYYIGGKPFYYIKTNDDNTLMFLAKDASDFSMAGQWNEDSLTTTLNETSELVFNDAEKASIKPLDVVYTKYGDTPATGRLYLYPITKTLADGILKDKLSRESAYWTASYKDKNTAYYINTRGEVSTASKNAQYNILPAINVNLANIIAEDFVNGENNANVSTASEPRVYYPAEHEGNGIRYILKDDTNNKLTTTVTGGLTIEQGKSENISYSDAIITAAGSYSDATSANYIDALIYEEGKDTLLYFGRLKKITNSTGEVTIKIPEDIPVGTYDIAFIEETVNSNGKSNTASTPHKVSLTVTKKQKSNTYTPATELPATGTSVPKPAETYPADAKAGLHASYIDGTIFKFDTESGDSEHLFVVYKQGEDKLYSLVADAHDFKTFWDDTYVDEDGDYMDDNLDADILNAPDDHLNEFTETEKTSMTETHVTVDDLISGTPGEGTKKLFVPSLTEITALSKEGYQEALDNNLVPIDENTGETMTYPAYAGYFVKNEIFEKTAIAENPTQYYWLRTYAGDRNALLIVWGDGDEGTDISITGDTDGGNIDMYEMDYLPAANIDLSAAAWMVGDAKQGSYCDVNATPDVYDYEEIKDHLKPYYVANRLSLNVPSLDDCILDNAQPGVSYEIPYSGASTGSNMYLSAAIYKVKKADNTSELKYYGKLAKLTSTDGTATLTLPKSTTGLVKDDDYKYVIAFFAEEANSPYAFNYISSPIYSEFTVKNEKSLEFCDIEITNTAFKGENFTPDITVKDPDTGATIDKSQYDVTFHTTESCINDLVPIEEGKKVREKGEYWALIVPSATSDGTYTGRAIRKFHVSSSGTACYMVISPTEGYIYNGRPHIPTSIKVFDSNAEIAPNVFKELVPEEDYTYEVTNNVEVGTAKVTATLMGAYNGEVYKEFEIVKADMDVSCNNEEVTYNGAKHMLSITPVDEAVRTDPNTAIVIKCNGETFDGATDAGEYIVDWTVTNPNYNDAVGSNTLKINPLDASVAEVTLKKNSYPYAGGPIIPQITSVKVGTIEVPADSYEAAWANNENVGTAAGSLTFSKNFKGTKEGVTFTITAINLDTLSSEDITAEDKYYTGSPITPVIRINGTDIVGSSAFNIEYKDNENKPVDQIIKTGTYKATISSNDETKVEGSRTVTFNVLPVRVSDSNLTVTSKSTAMYSGEPVTDVIEKVEITVDEVTRTLEEGTDYEVAYRDNNAIGTGHFTITFKGNYYSIDPYEKDFDIIAGAIQMGKVTTIDTIYDGNQHEPVIEPKVPEFPIIEYSVKTILSEDERGIEPDASTYTRSIPADALINAGDYEVWYKITDAGFDPYIDYTRVNINPANMESGIAVTNIDVAYDDMPHPFTLANITTSGKAEAATVTFSTAENGEYTAEIPAYETSGAYTDAGNYDIWIKFEKPNYKTVIRKAYVMIRAVDIPYVLTGNTTYVYDGEPHSVRCTSLIDEATVTYSNGGEYTEEMPAFTDVGTHTVNIKIDAEGHDTTTVNTSLTIIPDDIDAELVGYSGPYDSENQSLKFKFNKPAAHLVKITYSEDGVTYKDTVPFKTNVGRHKIYYKLEAENYNTKTGWVEINITSVNTMAAEAYGYNGIWDGKYHSPNVVVAVPESGYTVSYSTDNGETWSTELPKFRAPGNHPVKWKVEDDAGVYNSLSGSADINIGPITRLTIEEEDLNPEKTRTEGVKEIVDEVQVASVIIGSTVGGGVTGEAFSEAGTLEKISADPSNPNYSSKDGILYDKMADTLISVPQGKDMTLELLTNPYLRDVSVIGDSALENHEELTGAFRVPTSVKEIGDNAFRNTGLTGIYFPDTVTKIGAGAFADNPDITSITIAGDPEIGAGAFAGTNPTNIIYSGGGSTIAYVPRSVEVSDGEYILNSDVIRKIAPGAIAENESIKTIIITGGEVVDIGEGALRDDVVIRVPQTKLNEMKSANPEYADQMVGYKLDMSGAAVNLAEEGRKYKIGTDGTMPTPEISSVKLNGKTLSPDTDYTTSYSYDIKGGTVTVTGKGDYEGKVTKPFTFEKTGQLIIDTTSTMIEDEFINKTNNLRSGLHTPKATLRTTLDKSVGADVKTRAETENIILRMEYREPTAAEQKIVEDFLKGTEYDGVVSAWDIAVYYIDEGLNKVYLKELNSAIDFNMEIPEEFRNMVSYGMVRVHDNKAAEIDLSTTATSAEYSSSLFSTFALAYESEEPMDDGKFVATLPAAKYTKTGKPITPSVTVKYDNVPLALGLDYTVTYINNIEEGLASAIVTGIGYFEGIEKKLDFAIVAGGSTPTGDISKVTATLAGASEYIYTGDQIKPIVYVLDNSSVLVEGQDYQLFYQNNVDAGNAKVIISGINAYTGYRGELTFKINPKNISSSDVKVDHIEESVKLVDGEAVQSPKITYNDKTLKKGTDYRLSYKDNKKAGKTATLTITGINNFTGSVDYDFDVKEGEKTAETSANPLSNVKLDQNGRVPVSVSGNIVMTKEALSQGGTLVKSAKTNDISTVNIMLGIILLLISGGGIGFMQYRKRKMR